MKYLIGFIIGYITSGLILSHRISTLKIKNDKLAKITETLMKKI